MGDVNSDSKPDLIVANYGSNNTGILLNTGSGIFLPQTNYSTPSGPASVAVADVNNDNKIDIIIANFGSNNIGVLLNTGNGTFLSQTNYFTSTQPYAIAAVDVDGDNKPDTVMANQGSSSVSVFLDTGNGTFRPQTIYSTGAGSATSSVTVADVNGDTKPDMIVPNYIRVLLSESRSLWEAHLPNQ